MIDIIIQYPFMHFQRKAIGKVPSSWNELTGRQFIVISKMVDGAQPDYKFLSILTGIKKEILKKLSLYQLLKLSQKIDFISKAGTFYENFIIKDFPGAMNLVSPKPKMAGITFGQFIFFDSYYNDWIINRQPASLNKFIASLYLLPGEIFKEENIYARLALIEPMDTETKKAIAFNYALAIGWIQLAYPMIFTLREENPTGRDQPKEAQQSAWIKLFESMVGEDLINRDRYAELPLHTVFRHLTKKFKENARK